MPDAPLTDEQLAEWRTLADAATPGPWWADGHEIYAGAEEIAALSRWVGETCRADDVPGSEADGAFAAAARQAVPALLAEVAALQREVAHYRGLNVELNASVLRLSGIVAAVAEKHHPMRRMLTHGPVVCVDDGHEWPCPTTHALVYPDPKPELKSPGLLNVLGIPEDVQREVDAKHSADLARIRESERRAVAETRDVIIGLTPVAKSEPDDVVRRCPPEGSGLTPCCGRTPFELPLTDRMTLDPTLVTCQSALPENGGE